VRSIDAVGASRHRRDDAIAFAATAVVYFAVGRLGIWLRADGAPFAATNLTESAVGAFSFDALGQRGHRTAHPSTLATDLVISGVAAVVVGTAVAELVVAPLIDVSRADLAAAWVVPDLAGILLVGPVCLFADRAVGTPMWGGGRVGVPRYR
jgi:ABC-type uncharacterized transport system permease subunit